MTRIGIGLLCIFAAFGLRLVWDEWPSLATCSLFWGVMFCSTILLRNYHFIPGIGCNCLVTVGNDGFMPVYGTEKTSGGLHVLGTPDAAFQFFSDRFVGGCSIGDALIFAALLASLVRLMRHRRMKAAVK